MDIRETLGGHAINYKGDIKVETRENPSKPLFLSEKAVPVET